MKKTKFKPKHSVSRRVKITGTGKVLRGRSFGRHLKANKKKKNSRVYKKTVEANKVLTKKIKKALGI
ncbi:MAG: bL35 family ribosomal protein [Patescibacteria group bacterium]